jgi:hypothetical protein
MKPTMTDEETLVTLGPGDYDAIEAAVMETTRGRWFLREYARRNRNADTEAVLAAVAGLEKKIADENTARAMDQIRTSLLDMAGAIEGTKAEFAPVRAEDTTPLVVGNDAARDETDRRIARILETLRYLEERIQAMMALCDPQPPASHGASHLGPMAGFAQAEPISVTLN